MTGKLGVRILVLIQQRGSNGTNGDYGKGKLSQLRISALIIECAVCRLSCCTKSNHEKVRALRYILNGLSASVLEQF